MLLSKIASVIAGESSIREDLDIRRFSTDTRTLSGRPYELFVAVNGKRDGHDFIAEALDKGVKNFLIEKDINIGGCNSVRVENSIQALQAIAKSHRERFDIPTIGITGSNGKTTVKEWLAVMLSEKYFVVKSPKSFNSQIGVPLSVLEIQSFHEVGVFEAGISKTQEMDQLAEIIQPTIGIFTTLGSAHSEGFENDTEKLHEKLELFQNCETVICRNDAWFSSEIINSLGSKVKTWSTKSKADYSIRWSNGILEVNGTQFRVSLRVDSELENVTHAVICSLEMGLSIDEIQKGLNLIKPIPMRLELKKGINGCFLLDDTYNNDLIGIKVALDYLESHKQNNRKTLILSDILQSGDDDEKLYQKVNELLIDHHIDRFIGVGTQASDCADLITVEKEFFESTNHLLNQLPEFNKEMIIVKGARDFQLEKIIKRLELRTHRTVLEVNFEAIQHNLNQYRDLLKPSTSIMVMVKANAYGSGILEVANFLQHQRVDRLGVAYVDEAIQLRKHGIHIPIMIMNPDVNSFQDFETYKLEAEIYSLSHFTHFLSNTSKFPPIHLKIDTGMHRLGFGEQDIPQLKELLRQHKNLKVEGIFTHFSASENTDHDEHTIAQSTLFGKIYQELIDVLGYKPIKHACNSSGIVRWPQYHFDMVRLGIGLHGFDPSGTLDLRYTSQLKSAISQIQDLKKGERVGYSRRGFVNKNSRIAILPIGYEDGFVRAFGNGNAKVYCNGKLCPTIGNVCMDMVMVDVSEVEAKEGDEVIIFGASPTISNLAEWARTIPYEILTNISDRVKRIFIWE